jgi:hypothetical protein
MAMSSAAASNPSIDDGSASRARKFKASDLPLPSATRAAIESLAHGFKKEGAYDVIRKQVWEKFEASVSLLQNATKQLRRRINPSSRTTKNR